MSENRTAIASLFDFKLKAFVTPKALRFFYAFIVILLSLFALGATVILLFNSDFGSQRILYIILIVPAYFLYLLIIRIWFEYLTVIFKIHENTSILAERREA